MEMLNVSFFSSGKKIAARLLRPDTEASAPAILLCHGYSGDKQEYDAMAQYLCSNGFITLQLDMRGCGDSEAARGRMMCSTEWLEDTASAVSYLCGVDGVDVNRIGITGCSMGGAITLIMTALDRRIRCAVAMAPLGDGFAMLKGNWLLHRSVAKFKEFLREIREDANNTVMGAASKYVSVPYALGMNEQDTRDFFDYRDAHPEMVRDVPLESVMNSLILNRPNLFCPMVSAPFLIIHGSGDTVVPIAQSHEMKKLMGSCCELITIEGAPHPLPTSEYAEEVFAHALAWFQMYL